MEQTIEILQKHSTEMLSDCFFCDEFVPISLLLFVPVVFIYNSHGSDCTFSQAVFTHAMYQAE